MNNKVTGTTLNRRIVRNWQMYVFLFLPLLYLFIFCYYPMLGLQLAFKEFDMGKGMWGSPWVGLSQFRRFLTSPMFSRVFRNTLTISLYNLFAGFPIPIIFALLLNSERSVKFRKVVQTVTYLPHFISIVVMVGILLQIFNSRIGIYGTLHMALYKIYPEDMLGKARVFPHLYVWSDIWKTFGWSSIIYFAALSSVSQELYEAAEIDGANRFRRVIHIDFPSILPTATIMLILRAGQVLSVGYEKALLMQNSLNLSTSEIISTYVYKVGFGASGIPNYSYSTAIGLFNSAINLIMLVLVNKISSKMSETSLW